MSFVSYAQNFEDVILHRALRDVTAGVYVDVGAQDPDVFTVTRAFYEAGWSGINIEPVRFWFDALQQRRPRDLNLNIAVSDKKGSLRFFEIEDTGLSTASEQIAENHRASGFSVKQIDVPVTTLAEVLDEHGVTDIHFLKIDVEGEEGGVLRGMDFKRWRPWVLVIEATEPMSPKLAPCEWEPMVLEAGYERVYFDGLNLYYLAIEQSDRKQHFAVPPNVFDAFIGVKEAEAISEEPRRIAELDRLQRAYELAMTESRRVALRSAQQVKELEDKQRQLEHKENHVVSLVGQVAELQRANTAEITLSHARAGAIDHLEAQVSHLHYAYAGLEARLLKVRMRRRLILFLEAGHRLNQRSRLARATWRVIRPAARMGYRVGRRLLRRL
jgi:FkbM family methyltransferase